MKSIQNFERYMIDENGTICDTENNNREICQWIDNVGYKQCNLYKDGKKYYRRVHRLVAQTFIDNPCNYPQVNHINGIKTDNRVENLEWTTNSKNTLHGYQNNLYKHPKYTFVIDVYKKDSKEFLGEFESIRSMSEKLNINRKTVTSILNNEKTNNYPYIFEYIEKSPTTIESVSVI